MQDLDIRGAGNLLGAEQSGFIADIGFETYQKIMNEAVAELRAEGLHVPGLSDGEQEVVEQMRFIDDAHIDIEVEAALPDAYVSQQAERLKLYRELDSTKDEEALQAFESRLADRFGVQCVVVGIDSRHEEGSDEYRVNQFTGDEKKTRVTQWSTLDWVEEVQKRGAGEIVLNMMNQDGVRRGYDLRQLAAVRSVCRVPLIASGGAGEPVHFLEAFRDAKVDGALAASVFHKKIINIGDLKNYLRENNIEVRTC